MHRWPCVSLAVTTRVAFNDCTGCLGEKSWNLQMDAEHMRLESSAAGYICNIICDKLFMASYLIQFFNLKHTFHHYIYILMYQDICQHLGMWQFCGGDNLIRGIPQLWISSYRNLGKSFGNFPCRERKNAYWRHLFFVWCILSLA